MCGIAGILRYDGAPIERASIEAMVGTLRHRGPDGEGVRLAPGIACGSTRLAILDLTPASNQPFRDEGADLTLVFNGEIYNYVELRKELEGRGHAFHSRGDTEVLLRAYQEWGEDCPQHFNGMFAFAIWDGRRSRLLLARDRFGEKPLFISRTSEGLAFASEMKAILAVQPERRRPNRQAIYRYLSRGDLNVDEATFFDGIDSLPPAHTLVVEPDGRERQQAYWHPAASELPKARHERIEHLRELLFDAIRIRLRSDVTVGSSLSGGLDSSSIVAAIDAQKGLQQIRQGTFSARFRSETHDEGRFIKRLSRQVETEPHEVWVDADRFTAELSRLQYHQEEPIASSSPYAQWLVMELAQQHDTTVLLDGQGADEVLSGYDQAHGMFWAHWLRQGRLDRFLGEVVSFSRRYSGLRAPALFGVYYSLPEQLRDRLAGYYYRSENLVSEDLRHEFAPAHATSDHPFDDRLRNELVRWQTTTQLPEFLRYADRSSMAFGREVRLPFLDHRLVEYCFALPPDLLLRRAVTKVALREAMRGIVPDTILDRKDKIAYAPPQERWLLGPLQRWLQETLARAEGRDDVFNPEAVRNLRELATHDASDPLIWRVASTEIFFAEMINRSTAPATV